MKHIRHSVMKQNEKTMINLDRLMAHSVDFRVDLHKVSEGLRIFFLSLVVHDPDPIHRVHERISTLVIYSRSLVALNLRHHVQDLVKRSKQSIMKKVRASM